MGIVTSPLAGVQRYMRCGVYALNAQQCCISCEVEKYRKTGRTPIYRGGGGGVYRWSFILPAGERKFELVRGKEDGGGA
tara:strand:- start:126 stop:362 length:237 start_codon:yes stop_codon:yes gene_type:complete